MKKIDFKKNIFPNLAILCVFIIAACMYCAPILEGKNIFAGDSINGTAAVHESVEYAEQTGEHTWWNGAMFSGMPGIIR